MARPLLPSEIELPWIRGTNHLLRVFNDVASSYKYFWFWGLLECTAHPESYEITFEDLVIEMVKKAWYPHHYFHLNFGTQDRLAQHIDIIRKAEGLEEDVTVLALDATLRSPQRHSDTSKVLGNLMRYVPYRFLQPWMDEILRGKRGGNIEKDTVRLAEQLARDPHRCPIYHFSGPSKQAIFVKPEWLSYLSDHHQILKNFLFWHLAQYLQDRNPNVPNVLHKIEYHPAERDQNAARKLWTPYMQAHPETRCIFSDEPIHRYDIDHFLPWSFVAHNDVWNTVPIPPSVNSQKGNRIPIVTLHVPGFLTLQYALFQFVWQAEALRNKQAKTFQAYTNLFKMDELRIAELSFEAFATRMREQVEPMISIARSQGFGEFG